MICAGHQPKLWRRVAAATASLGLHRLLLAAIHRVYTGSITDRGGEHTPDNLYGFIHSAFMCIKLYENVKHAAMFINPGGKCDWLTVTLYTGKTVHQSQCSGHQEIVTDHPA